MKPDAPSSDDTPRTRIGGGPLMALALLAANAIVPLVWGDVYPLTSAPMFRDAPVQAANHRVFAPGEQELAEDAWLVQRVYDGNPVGYGVGICPPPVLEQEYGRIPSEAEVRDHIARQFARGENGQYSYVEVVQEELGALPSGKVGVVVTRRWRVDKPQTLSP